MQLGKTEDNSDPDIPVKPDDWGLVSDNVNRWMELPSVDVKNGFAYVFHRCTMKGNDVRNYSIYYDAANRIALWVAYPICADYIGHMKRTDAWGFDPKIPQKYQPELHRGWPWGGTRRDRGHQLPSGSRTGGREMNMQTFYYTNMTAQVSGLNQNIWAKSEGMVRGYSSTCDTLYVVTGPVLSTKEYPAIEYVKDNAGQNVALPKAYFKVLLKYHKKTETYQSIGFWFENRDYDRAQPAISDLKSVSQIEDLTGFKFFDNLPDEIEKSVKSQFEPSKWGFN